MEFNKALSSFIITIAIAATIFIIWFGVVMNIYPEMLSQLLTCGIAVACVLIGLIGIGIVTISAAANKDNILKKEKNKKIS